MYDTMYFNPACTHVVAGKPNRLVLQILVSTYVPLTHTHSYRQTRQTDRQTRAGLWHNVLYPRLHARGGRETQRVSAKETCIHTCINTLAHADRQTDKRNVYDTLYFNPACTHVVAGKPNRFVLQTLVSTHALTHSLIQTDRQDKVYDTMYFIPVCTHVVAGKQDRLVLRTLVSTRVPPTHTRSCRQTGMTDIDNETDR